MDNEIKKTCKIECPNCGKVYEHYVNYWGKICIYCKAEILPSKIPDFIKKNKAKKEYLKNKAIEQVKRNSIKIQEDHRRQDNGY